MGKDVKKKFTVSLDIEMKDAEKQVKATVGNLKTILADLGNASDKMGYFKDLVDYIGQIDTALTALRNKNKDAFDHMFDGLDENLRKQLEGLFGTSGSTLSQLNVLHDKLATLTPKSGIKELRNFAKEIDTLFTSIGVDSPFEDVDKQFFGKANSKHIQLLTDALSSFATVWDGVNNKIKNGFGFSGSGSGAGTVSTISDKVQEEINKLKKQQQEIQDVVNAINNPEKVNIKLSKKSTEQVEQLKTLKQSFLDAASAKIQLENANMTGSNEYLNAVANYVKAAAELKSAFESESLSNQGIDWVVDNGTSELQDADKVLNNFLKKNTAIMSKVQSMYSEKIGNISDQIEFLTKPYDTLKEKLQEYVMLQNLMSHEDRLSDDELDEVDKKIQELDKYLLSLDNVGDKQNEIKNILGDIAFDGMSDTKALEEFCHLLSVDIPNAAQKAEDALKSVDTGDTTSDSTRDLQDDLSKIGKEAQESSQEVTVALDRIENKTQDVAATFQDLVNYISQSGMSPSKFFDKIESGAQSADDELNKILQSLKLIDSSGNINLESIKSGFTNKGGFVSDQYTMIARPDWYLPKIESLQPMLAEAKQAGAQIGAIFDIIEDKANGLIYEVQNTVAGTAAFSHHNNSVNQDALNATEDQIKGLVNTLHTLQQKGLFIDWGGDNVLYDKDKGFSVIDLGNKGGKSHTVSKRNTMQENLDRFVSEMFKFDKGVMQSSFVDNLYKAANDMGNSVVNPYATQSSKQHQAIQDSANKATAAIKTEENAHEQNAAAINAENAALQAQIELKKKAQSMKWEAFALDESSSDLKKAAGFQTLSDMEKFWKKSNYEKQIDWHEMTKSEALDVLSKKLPFGLASDWYGPQKFHVKDKLENEILADDEVRNASLNFLYSLYKEHVPFDQKNPNVKTFEDFLNTEFTVYRNDDAPLIYGDESKLSFSFDKLATSGFDTNQGTAKIFPKDTVGNAGSGIESEVEVFVDSYKTEWFKQTGEAFSDYYKKQTKEMQNEIDIGLINLEKQRVSDILGSNFTKLTHKAGKTSDFQNSILKQFQQGIVPDNIISSGLGDINDEFANAYNGLSSMGKKLAAYYASMDAISSSMPQQFSISGWKESSKDMVGEDAKLFNAVLSDPTGVKKHVASLTGELGYNLFNKSEEEIKAETDAIKQHTKAIQDNSQAQQVLNKPKLDSVGKKLDYSSVDKKLYDATEEADTIYKYKALSGLYNDLESVHNTEMQHPEQISKNLYISDTTGEVLYVSEIFDAINDIEQKYGENLSYVKDYLHQVYSNLSANDISKNSSIPDASDALNTLYGIDFGYDLNKMDEIQKVIGSLNIINDTDSQMLDDGMYQDKATGEVFSAQKLYDLVDKIEWQYSEDLTNVKEYLNKVFAKWHEGLNELNIELDDDLIDPTDPENATNDFDKMYWKLEALNDGNSEKFDAIAKLQSKLSDISYDTKNNVDLIDQGKFMDSSTWDTTDWAEVSDLVSDFEVQYGENLEYVHDYLKKVFAKQHEELDQLFNGFGDTDDLFSFDQDSSSGKQYTVQDYEEAYKLQNSSIQEAINDLAILQQEYEELQSKINSDPILISNLETQLEAKQQEVYDGVSQDFRDMIDTDSSDSLEQYIMQLAKQLQVQKEITAEKQKQESITDQIKSYDDTTTSQQELNTEQNITEEKQEQLVTESGITAEKQAQVALDKSFGNVQDKAIIDNIVPENDIIETSENTNEAVVLDDLLVKVNAVEQAIKDKTEAFREEGTVVEQTVAQEVTALEKLSGTIDSVKSSIDGKTQAFKNEGVVVGQVVKQEQDILKQQNTNKDGSSNDDQDDTSNKTTKKKVTPDQKADKALYIGALNKYKKDIKKEMGKLDFTSLDHGLSESQQEIAGLYNDTIHQIEQYVAAVKNGEDVELDSIQNSIAALKEKAKVYKEQNNLTDSGNVKNAKNKTAYGQNVISTISGKYNSLQSKINVDSLLSESEVLQVKFAEYEASLYKVTNLYNQLKTIDPTESDKASFKQASAECNNLAKEVEKLILSYEKLHNDPNKIGELSLGDDFDATDENSRKQALLDYVQSMHGAKATIGDFKDYYKTLLFTIDNGDGTFTEAKASIDNLGTAIVATASDTIKATSKFSSFFESLKNKFGELWIYAASRFGVDEIIQQVRQGIQYVREIDTALTELKKVTNETDASYDAFLQDMSRTGSIVGATVSDLTTMASEWARLGYSMEEAGKLAESTAILLNVSEFQDATAASEALISTMQAFQYTADESQHVVDILNEVGKLLPVDNYIG